MLIDVVVLGMLGCIDVFLILVVVDSLICIEYNFNKELVGQGIGNVMFGLFGGLGGVGVIMGMVVNIQFGGCIVLFGLIWVMVLLVVILGVVKLVVIIFLVVLVGIVFKVGVDIIDWGFFKWVYYVFIKGVLIMYVVIVLMVLVDLIVVVGIGVFIVNIFIIDCMSVLQFKVVKSISDVDDEIFFFVNEKCWLDEGNGWVLFF